jgi:hypothetical protein
LVWTLDVDHCHHIAGFVDAVVMGSDRYTLLLNATSLRPLTPDFRCTLKYGHKRPNMAIREKKRGKDKMAKKRDLSRTVLPGTLP